MHSRRMEYRCPLWSDQRVVHARRERRAVADVERVLAAQICCPVWRIDKSFTGEVLAKRIGAAGMQRARQARRASAVDRKEAPEAAVQIGQRQVEAEVIPRALCLRLE